ncbi:MAG: hypothetical protein ABL895_15045 [Cyclobacteriaceae bacterium]
MKRANQHKRTLTAYGVFIIESLRDGEYKDGERLNKILEMAKINSLYRWVTSKTEFTDAIKDFNKSGFRYLHLSCHADETGLEVGGEEISNFDLIDILEGNVRGRRIFLSSCKGSNLHTATVVIQKCKGQSVVGTPIDIYFHEAALFWPSFYYVINRIDKEKMNQQSISESIKKCVDLFEVPINYYCKSKTKGYINRYKFKSTSAPDKKLIKIAENIR